MNDERALYTPAFGISLDDVSDLQVRSGELLAFLDAFSCESDMSQTSRQTLASIAWERAMDIAEIANTVETQHLTNRSPLTFTNKEALEIERLVSLFAFLIEVRDDVPESLQKERESVNALKRKLIDRNRMAGLYEPKDEKITEGETRKVGAA